MSEEDGGQLRRRKRKPDEGYFFGPTAHFDGPVYDPKHDLQRLTKQIGRVYTAMQEGHWLTLREIADRTNDPEASISAQLRHLRKARFGGYTIDKRHRGDPAIGLWEYKLWV